MSIINMQQDHKNTPHLIQINETQINLSNPSRKSQFSGNLHYYKKPSLHENMAGKSLEVIVHI